MLCFLLLVSLPTEARAATNSITTRSIGSNFADKKIKKLKTGNNKITIKNNEDTGLVYRGVRYTAPKDGTYVFKFKNLRSSTIDFPMCSLTAHYAPSVRSKSYHYQQIEMTLKGSDYRSLNLISPDWAMTIGDRSTIESLNESNYMDYATLTLPLKKGMTVVISFSLPYEVVDEYLRWESTTKSMVVDCKISRSK